MSGMKEFLLRLQESIHHAPVIDDLEAYATALGGEVTGPDEIAAPSPGCNADDRSLIVKIRPGAAPFVYDCIGSLSRAIAHVRSALGTLEPLTTAADEEQRLERQSMALRIWGESETIQGSPAERYLHDRAIHELPPDSLRYHKCCPFGQDVRPAMIGLFRHVLTDEPTAIHRTCIRTRERRALGPVANAAIKLWRQPSAAGCLVVGEGIETVLSAALAIPDTSAFRQPAWALGSAGAVRRFPVIPNVEQLVIVIDNDVNGAGPAAAAECTKRWAGHEIVQLKPRELGKDFNDVAVKRAMHD